MCLDSGPEAEISRSYGLWLQYLNTSTPQHLGVL
jgi:hypothetical protein